MGKIDRTPAALSPVQGLLLGLILDGTRDPARMELLALCVSHGVFSFREALRGLDYSTFGELSDACTRADYELGAKR